MASLRVPLALVALATVSCAAIIGIQTTIDDTTTIPDRDFADADADPDDDDAAIVEIRPEDDAGSYADVENIDAPVTTCAEPGLVARWKLDEMTGTVAADCSGNKLHGIITKGTWDNNGNDGGALRLNGDGWVGFANPSLLRITGTFSVSLWMRYDKTTTTTEYVVGKTSDPGNNGWRLGVIDSASKLALATPSSASNFNAVGGTVPLAKWQHVAALFDAGNMTAIYLNGTRVGLHSNAPSAMVSTNAEARIGARFDGLYGLHGAVSDVRIYNRVLSASEISTLATR